MMKLADVEEREERMVEFGAKKKKKEEADNMNIGRFSAVFVELTPLSPHPLLPSTWKSPRLAQN